MKIRTKLIASSIGLACIPVIIATLILGWIAVDSGSKAISQKAEDQLISIRDITAENISGYFETIHKQLITYSNNRMIIDAMAEFSSAYAMRANEADLSNISSMKSSVESYYREHFSRTYKTKNNGTAPELSALTEDLSDTSIALQYGYMSNNKHPLGEKNILNTNGSGSQYDQVHEKFHPFINQYLTEFHYYDIFLVDTQGNVVYSVFKEVDYATSLVNGPYANSGLAQAYREIQKSNGRDKSILIDFKPYMPSYEAPASFTASPIYDGRKQIGTLIFQMPIDKINEVMTHGERWSEVGLGASGETYLVATDFTMRSMSRFMAEDKPAYLELMADIGLDQSVIDELDSKGTSIGIQPARTVGIEKALAGETGFEIFPDYRGVNVLSAYTHISVEGLEWALMSEIDEDESFEPIYKLKQLIQLDVLIFTIVAIILGSILGLFLANQIIKPINATVATLRNIAEDEADLTQRLDESKDDEMAELAYWFNLFASRLQGIINEINASVLSLASSAEQLSQLSTESSANISEQHMQTEQAATAMTEMSASVEEVSRNAITASEKASNANDLSHQGRNVIKDCREAINQLGEEIQEAESVISVLHEDSEQVAGVLAVIEGIAEQTNLLALNAAIEAARAGESGRGFAVVADEVRTLAKRTQESTIKIQAIVDRFQSGSKTAVDVMERSKKSSQSGIEKTDLANESFTAIVNAINEISDNNAQIATATEEQSTTSAEVSKNMTLINQVAESNMTNSAEIDDVSTELSKIAHSIQDKLSDFKT